MGSFNTVNVPCPECGVETDHQSKAGACAMKRYPLKRAPLADLASAASETFVCSECDTRFHVHVRVRAWTDSVSEEQDED